MEVEEVPAWGTSEFVVAGPGRPLVMEVAISGSGSCTRICCAQHMSTTSFSPVPAGLAPRPWESTAVVAGLAAASRTRTPPGLSCLSWGLRPRWEFLALFRQAFCLVHLQWTVSSPGGCPCQVSRASIDGLLFWYFFDDFSCTSQQPQPWHLRFLPKSCPLLRFFT